MSFIAIILQKFNKRLEYDAEILYNGGIKFIKDECKMNEIENKTSQEQLDILPPPKWHKAAMVLIIVVVLSCIVAGSIFTVVSISHGGPDSPDRVINRLEAFVNSGDTEILKDILPMDCRTSQGYIDSIVSRLDAVDPTQEYQFKISDRRTYTQKELDSSIRAIRKGYKELSELYPDFDYTSDVGYVTIAEHLTVDVVSVTKPEYRPTPTPKPTPTPTAAPTVVPTAVPEGVAVVPTAAATPTPTVVPTKAPDPTPEPTEPNYTTELGEFEIVAFKVDGKWCLEHLVY